MSEMDVLVRLHRGLKERRAPQAVAVDLLELGAEKWLSAVGVRDLYRIVRYEQAHPKELRMPENWRRHPGLSRAYEAAAGAVAGITTIKPADPDDPESLRRWLDGALELLGLPRDEPPAARATIPRRARGPYRRLPKPRGARGDHGGHADARERMDAATRRERLPGVSVRTYRRAVRAVLHLQQRTEVLAQERDREASIAFGKARLAHLVSEAEFAACPATAAFTAYYVARLNMRTQFTSGSQTRPMDTLAEELLAGALAARTCRPAVLASVLTRWSVLDRLSDVQCGELLGRYYEQLAASARALQRSYDIRRDPAHMVVRAGDDSSTWNAASRAFNQARTGWLNATLALGYDDVVEASCPGKVPALVASDVAAWHQFDGGEQHTDVRVWAALPLPWEVVLGEDDCPAELVREVCRHFGIDAEATGWTQPYRQDKTERPEPAPELVHGVTVSSPLLAHVLRSNGIFSGQSQNYVVGEA
ncbi:hypothetical protein [Paractinoplanes lichenicola]|uniref:Uncharacterized protein n=1 Tax=Paractinoplanes lichenicola TaxID=2802976 RepID=A0ABS1VZM2_9ACTN|nr:hypothetical protein [Actinoplanes lichenicola]MBL7259946.1 hypothetical protein [Actinoplanes lichenicola]